jgi:hypothetical protein
MVFVVSSIKQQKLVHNKRTLQQDHELIKMTTNILVKQQVT